MDASNPNHLGRKTASIVREYAQRRAPIPVTQVHLGTLMLIQTSPPCELIRPSSHKS